MESFATKPMKFDFGKKPAQSTDNPAEPTESETALSPNELGSVLAEAMKSGSGEAVYEAVRRIVDAG